MKKIQQKITLKNKVFSWMHFGKKTCLLAITLAPYVGIIIFLHSQEALWWTHLHKKNPKNLIENCLFKSTCPKFSFVSRMDNGPSGVKKKDGNDPIFLQP